MLHSEGYVAISSASSSVSCTSCVNTEQFHDDWGRPVENILASDPSGATTVETTYGSSGRVLSLSNPYRTTTDRTFGFETYSYDGLDRIISHTHADGNVVHIYYGAAVTGGGGIGTQLCPVVGYPVLRVDEAGHKSETWTDAFGNPVETDEPDSTAGWCALRYGVRRLATALAAPAC